LVIAPAVPPDRFAQLCRSAPTPLLLEAFPGPLRSPSLQSQAVRLQTARAHVRSSLSFSFSFVVDENLISLSSPLGTGADCLRARFLARAPVRKGISRAFPDVR
jgi:hypothetical protein